MSALRVGLAGLMVAAGLLRAVPATGAPDLSAPWPASEAVAGIEGEAVAFPSRSPFGLAEVGGGPEVNPPTTARGTLFLPEDAAAGAPVPAVVMLHGASGVQDAREMTYGRQLAARGAAALVLDVFAARRGRANGFVDRLLRITEAMFLADAFAALDYLRDRPETDGRRVVLMGFSYGGMAATYAAYAQVAERYAPDGSRFAAHVAFYAPCIAEFADSRATGAPLMMLFGARDAIVDADRCGEVAGALSRGGAEVRMVIYRDAAHQWDGHFRMEREIGRDLSDCRFEVGRDGAVQGSYGLPLSTPFLRKLSLALCAAGEGYLIGADDAVRARSNRDLGHFLDGVFRNAP